MSMIKNLNHFYPAFSIHTMFAKNIFKGPLIQLRIPGNIFGPAFPAVLVIPLESLRDTPK